MNSERYEHLIKELIRQFRAREGDDASLSSCVQTASEIRSSYQDIDDMTLYDGAADLFLAIAENTSCDPAKANVLAQMLFIIALFLVTDRHYAEAAELLITFTRNVLFSLYLTDRYYYRCVITAYYQVTRTLSYAHQYGYYDPRHMYDRAHAQGKDITIDLEYAVIPGAVAQTVQEQMQRGLSLPEDPAAVCTAMSENAVLFERMLHGTSRLKSFRYNGDARALYKKIFSEKDTGRAEDAFSPWYGLAFAIDVVCGRYQDAVKLAEAAGCAGHTMIPDTREKGRVFKYAILAMYAAAVLFGIYLFFHAAKIWTLIYVIALLATYHYVFHVPDAVKNSIHGTNVLEDIPYETRHTYGLSLAERLWTGV